MPSSAPKTDAAEHLRQFSAMVEAVRGASHSSSKELSKKDFARTVSVVSTISDLSAFLPREAANLVLVDVAWALSRMPPSFVGPDVQNLLISTVARWAERCERLRLFLRDDLRLLATLPSCSRGRRRRTGGRVCSRG